MQRTTAFQTPGGVIYCKRELPIKTAELTEAQRVVLSKDILTVLINRIAAYRNKNPNNKTAERVHALLDQAWNEGTWLSEGMER